MVPTFTWKLSFHVLSFAFCISFNNQQFMSIPAFSDLSLTSLSTLQASMSSILTNNDEIKSDSSEDLLPGRPLLLAQYFWLRWCFFLSLWHFVKQGRNPPPLIYIWFHINEVYFRWREICHIQLLYWSLLDSCSKNPTVQQK